LLSPVLVLPHPHPPADCEPQGCPGFFPHEHIFTPVDVFSVLGLQVHPMGVLHVPKHSTIGLYEAILVLITDFTSLLSSVFWGADAGLLADCEPQGCPGFFPHEHIFTVVDSFSILGLYKPIILLVMFDFVLHVQPIGVLHVPKQGVTGLLGIGYNFIIL
jgi:hypothetical protein